MVFGANLLQPLNFIMKKLTVIQVLILSSLIIFSDYALADEVIKKDNVDYKLTLSYYSTKESQANDVNMRASRANQTVWLGYYRETQGKFDQFRAGYERTDQIPFTKIVSSFQVADHGFLGLSETAEIGVPFFALVGYGRTNLKPYNNINFDPNDAITYGIGWRGEDDTSISLYSVRDVRIIPGQRITHLFLRKLITDSQRITIDIFNKTGPNDDMGKSINATGTAITYDVSRYFLRFAYEPKVNFSQENMTRISTGVRF